ncbi:DUF4173 domain-containing protein [Candidatus Peregrinibacteria bacterium]|nr:MAG: DUF4173 domain-containing protein [Candidatus Peregrinibacteria bacterium]
MVRSSLLALVVLLIFGRLLIEADPIFAQSLDGFKGTFLNRSIITLLLMAAFVFLTTIKVKESKDEAGPLKALHFFDFALPALVLEILFLGFIFIQAKYLFGANESIVNFDITYSDYVRKGFIELLVTSLLGALLSYGMTLKSHALELKKHVNALKGLNLFLILELFVILASALQRDLIYMDVYGLTRIRFIGLFLLAWIAGLLFAMGIFSIWKRFTEHRLFTSLFLLSFLGFFALNMVNIDGWIAQASKNKDYFYINHLSTDAANAWEDSLEHAQSTLSPFISNTSLTDEEKQTIVDTQISLLTLQEKVTNLEGKYAPDTLSSWTAWNASEWKAFQKINEKPQLYHEQLSCLLTQVDQIQLNTFSDFKPQRNKRFYEYEYPLTKIEYPEIREDDYDLSGVTRRLFNVSSMAEEVQASYNTLALSNQEIQKDEHGLIQKLKDTFSSTPCLQ